MFLLEFTGDAFQLVNDYVEDAHKSLSQTVSGKNVDEKSLEIFLSEVEDEVKFLAIQLAMARKAKVVERQDVRKALRKLVVELFRSRRLFSLYHGEILGDVSVIKEKIEPLETSRILDAGCGWGRFSRRLCKHLGREAEVVGIDLDVLSLKYGKSVNRNFSVVRSHMSYLPFKPQVFDVIVCRGALHEIENKDNRIKALGDFARALKPNSMLYVYDSFARSRIANVIRGFLHGIFSSMEVYSQTGEFENFLKSNGFGMIRKSCFVWAFFSSAVFCSYIAVKA